jgi:hypothetical protein
MLLSFKHKMPQKQQMKNSTHDRIANNIVLKWIKNQERLASYMQHEVEKLSFKTKKVLVIIFFLLSAGYSFYLIEESLMKHKTKSISIDTIKFPGSIGKAGGERVKEIAIVPEYEYKRIRCFQLLIDSLARSPSGKTLHDSILHKPSGLIDSIIHIQEMFK